MASSASGQDVSNSTLWLDTRAGKMELSCSLGTTRRVPQEKFSRKPYNKSFSDQVSSVKMPGCWPRFFSWTSTLSRSINRQKRNLANIQPSWPRTWSITHTYGAYFTFTQLLFAVFNCISCTSIGRVLSTLFSFLKFLVHDIWDL